MTNTIISKDTQFSIMLRAGYPTILKICQTSKVAQQICRDPYFWREKLKTINPNFQYINNPNPQLIVQTLYDMTTIGARPHPAAYEITNNMIMMAVGIGIIAKDDATRNLIARLKRYDWGDFSEYVQPNYDFDQIILFPLYILSLFSHDDNQSLFIENRSSKQSFLLRIEDNIDDDPYLNVYTSILMTKFEEEVLAQRLEKEKIIQRDSDKDWFPQWIADTNRTDLELARPIIQELITSSNAHAGTWLMSSYW